MLIQLYTTTIWRTTRRITYNYTVLCRMPICHIATGCQTSFQESMHCLKPNKTCLLFSVPAQGSDVYVTSTKLILEHTSLMICSTQLGRRCVFFLFFSSCPRGSLSPSFACQIAMAFSPGPVFATGISGWRCCVGQRLRATFPLWSWSSHLLC